MVDRDWTGLYREGWTGLIMPEAFCHPAKYSRGLIRHIYLHAMAQGWLQAGDLVCDPFGGVALGALHAMQNSLHWIGVELEEKFVDLGQQNIDLWNERYADRMPGWGSAMILQGDSRELCAVVGEGMGAMVGSPPYSSLNLFVDYGNSCNWRSSFSRSLYSSLNLFVDYGNAAGQLTALPEGNPREAIDGVCESPPYESSEVLGGSHEDGLRGEGWAGRRSNQRGDYGNSGGQLGQSSGDTFWTASRQIMQQVHAILKPSGVAIWVCKRFVRKGQIVEFSQQWAQLGLVCGFEPLEWIRAWLVEDRGAQFALNGDLVERKVERKSFFRRLAESKGSPRIDWEDVIIQRKLPQAVSEAIVT